MSLKKENIFRNLTNVRIPDMNNEKKNIKSTLSKRILQKIKNPNLVKIFAYVGALSITSVSSYFIFDNDKLLSIFEFE